MDYTRHVSCLYGRIRHKLEYCYKLKTKERMAKANWQEKDFLTPISISTLQNISISAIGY